MRTLTVEQEDVADLINVGRCRGFSAAQLQKRRCKEQLSPPLQRHLPAPSWDSLTATTRPAALSHSGVAHLNISYAIGASRSKEVFKLL
jgi:hypothetical protein